MMLEKIFLRLSFRLEQLREASTHLEFIKIVELMRLKFIFDVILSVSLAVDQSKAFCWSWSWL